MTIYMMKHLVMLINLAATKMNYEEGSFRRQVIIVATFYFSQDDTLFSKTLTNSLLRQQGPKES